MYISSVTKTAGIAHFKILSLVTPIPSIDRLISPQEEGTGAE